MNQTTHHQSPLSSSSSQPQSMPEGWIGLDEILRNKRYILYHPCRWAHHLIKRSSDPDAQKRYQQLAEPSIVKRLLAVFEHALTQERVHSSAGHTLKYLVNLNTNQEQVVWPPADPHQITKFLEHLIRGYLQANHTSWTVSDLSVKGTAELMLNYVNLTLSIGNERGLWRIPLITDVSYVPYPENPLSRAHDRGYARFMKRVAIAFMEKIRQQPELDTLPKEVRLGIVAWSLMTESLISHSSTLLKICRKLCALNEISFIAGRMVIALRDNPKLPERWFLLSPITAALVTRAHLWNQSPPGDKKALQSALLAFLDWLQIRPFFYGLNAWCQAAQATSLSQVPTLMVSHRHGKVQGFAPYLESQDRLIPRAGPHLGVSSDREMTVRPDTPNPRVHAGDIRWVRKVLDLKSKNTEKVLSHIKQAREVSPPMRSIIEALFDWCVDTITPDGQRVRRSPYQMLARFDSIARHLVLALGENDIRDLSMQERARIYEAIKERAISASNLERITASLHAFEKWLVGKGRVKDGGLADDDELFGERQDRHIGVNAHLISVDDYLKARDALILLGQNTQLSATNREQATLAGLMLVLGFRLGLRWAEAVGLRHMDVVRDQQTGQPRSLIIRPHDQRTLKTLNARRTLPISTLLDKTELSMIQSQLERSGANGQSFLISRKKDMAKPLDTPMLREMVVKAIRTSTNNKYLRYHHLRHSFANWMMFSLAASQWRLDLEHVFRHLPETVQWLSKSDKRFAAISPVPVNDVPVNDNHAGFLLAQLIGHGSLGTTLYHYVHIMDVLTGLYLEQRYAPRHGPSQLSSLMGILEGTLKARLYKPDRKPHWGVLCLKHLLEKDTHDGGMRVLMDRQKSSRKLKIDHHPDIAQALAPMVLNPWEKSKLIGAEWLVAIPILLHHCDPVAALPDVNSILGRRLKQSTLNKLWGLLQQHPCLRLPALQPEQWEALAELAKRFKKRVKEKMGLDYPVFTHDRGRRPKQIDQLIEKAILTCRPLRSTSQIKVISPDKLIWKFTEQSAADAKEVIRLLQLMNANVQLKITVPEKTSKQRIRKEQERWRTRLGLSPKARFEVDYSRKLKTGSYIKFGSSTTQRSAVSFT